MSLRKFRVNLIYVPNLQKYKESKNNRIKLRIKTVQEVLVLLIGKLSEKQIS